MRCKFKFGVVLRHRGRQELVDWPEFVARQKKAESRAPKPPRIQALLESAYRLKAKLDKDPKLTRAALAREEGMDPSRLTQVLNLLNLAPDIQRRILALPASTEEGPITERRLRSIARMQGKSAQRRAFRALLGA